MENKVEEIIANAIYGSMYKVVNNDNLSNRKDATTRKLCETFKKAFIEYSQGLYREGEKQTGPSLKSANHLLPDIEVEFVKGRGVPHPKFPKECTHIIINYDETEGYYKPLDVKVGELTFNDYSYYKGKGGVVRVIKASSISKLRSLMKD